LSLTPGGGIFDWPGGPGFLWQIKIAQGNIEKLFKV